MDKPNFKKICLMYMQQLTNFPYIEKDFDALTDYALLCKVVEYLNEVIKNNNTQNETITNLYNAFIELKEFLEESFDELNLQDEVNNKLDEMANDGTLATIIGNYIGINNVNYLEQVAVLEYRPSTSDDIGMQGGCYAGDGNIVQYISSGKKIQVISLSTGEVLREATYNFLGHGNSLCMKDGYIYISGLLDSGITTNSIYKFNYNDLTDYEEINIYELLEIPTTINLFTISFDEFTRRWYMIKYPMFPTTTIYIFNEDFTSYDTFTFDNSTNYGGAIVNTCMYKGYYCIFYNDGKLTMLDKNFDVFKNIQIIKNFGSRYASEFEWISQVNDQELMFGIIGYDGKNYGGGNFLYAKTNLFSSNQTYSKGINPNNLNGKYPKIQTLYVDSEASLDVTRDGSRDKPFVSLYELSNALLTNDINICYIHGDFTNEGLYINNSRNVKIYNWVRDEETTSLINVRQLEVENVEQCYLRYIYPINSIEIKESKTLIKYDNYIDVNKVLSLQVYNTGHLIFDADDNVLTVKNYNHSEGIIEATKFIRINGLAKYYNDSTHTEYNEFCSCRNIKNIKTRCRYVGTWDNPTTYTFSLPKANVRPCVRLSSAGWVIVDVPQLYETSSQTQNIPLSSGDTLVATITNNSDNSNLIDVTLTTTTEKIWDIFAIYN